MENNKNMTVKEVLVIIMNRLNDISVPMKLKRQVADPIEQSIYDLGICIDAINKAEENLKAKVEEEPELAIEAEGANNDS